MDGLRAMREARYEQAAARTTTKPAAAPKTPTRAADRRRPAAEQPAAAQPGEQQPDAALCGHRAISGRTCTREHGHAAKSHRYS